jgi:hypothetical protein
MANLSYRLPGVSGAVSSAVQSAINPGARIMALIGTAGSGPDVPTLYTNSQAAFAAFGSPGAAGTLPWGIMAAMGVPTPGGTGAPCLIGRAGVTRASVILQDSGSATWATITGIGTYAGTPGNNLNAIVATGTLTGTRKITIQKGTGGTAVTLSVYDNLKLPTDLAAAAMNDPSIDVTPAASVLLPTSGTFALAGGVDGLTAAPTGNPDPVLTMMSLMFSGAYPAPRYLCPLWDATAVYADVQAVIATALGNTPTPTPVMAFLGSSLSGSIAGNASLAGTINTAQMVLWGIPGAMRYSAPDNAMRAFDGFYVAATLMGLKASIPVEYSGITGSLPGWAANINILSGGIYRPPTTADVVALGQNSAAFGLSGPGFNGLEVVDHLTTAQTYGTANAYQQQAAMMDSLHHTQERAYAAGNGFKGQPAPINSDLSNSISGRLHSSVKQLEGSAIAALNSVAVNPDPATVGRYLPVLNFDLRPTVKNLDLQFSVSVQS